MTRRAWRAAGTSAWVQTGNVAGLLGLASCSARREGKWESRSARVPQLQRGQFLRGFLCRFLRPHFARGVIPLHKGFIDAL